MSDVGSRQAEEAARVSDEFTSRRVTVARDIATRVRHWRPSCARRRSSKSDCLRELRASSVGRSCISVVVRQQSPWTVTWHFDGRLRKSLRAVEFATWYSRLRGWTSTMLYRFSVNPVITRAAVTRSHGQQLSEFADGFDRAEIRRVATSDRFRRHSTGCNCGWHSALEVVIASFRSRLRDASCVAPDNCDQTKPTDNLTS